MPIEQIPKIIRKNINFLPILILLFFSIESVIVIYSNDWLLEIGNYLAFGSVILNILVYFQFRRFYKYILLFTLIFGISNVFEFSADSTMVGFGINGLKFNFQLNALIASIITYIINFQKVNNLIIETFKNKVSPENQERIEMLNSEEGIQNFKERYANYPDDKLQQIINANKYLPEAIEAARQLLNQRQNNSPNAE